MDEQPIRTANHDSTGRFVKGSCANPKGNNQFTTLVPLIAALEEAGKKQSKDFWAMVAEKCFLRKNDALLIAILKKVLPDKIEGDLAGTITHMGRVLLDSKPLETKVGS